MGRRTNYRGKLGGRTVNRAEVRDALEDGRLHCAVGIVVHRPTESSHFEIIKDDAGNPVDVSVDVDIMPRQEAATCRLGALAGGPGSGIWRVPPPGAEVMVCIPRGELENGPFIVGELSTRSVPAALDQDSLVIINPGKVIMASKNDQVYLGTQDGTGAQPVHRKNDHGVGGTLTVTAAGTTVVTVTYVDPDGNSTGPLPTTGAGAVVNLKTKATEGAAGVQAK